MQLRSGLLSTQVLLGGIFVVLTLIMCIGIFIMGMHVGMARSQMHVGRNLQQAGFSKEQIRGMGMEARPGRRGRHGFGGEITQINGNTLTLTRRDGTVTTVVYSSKTNIRSRRGDDVTLANLNIGTHIVSVGKPDADGVIQAREIFVLPGPPG